MKQLETTGFDQVFSAEIRPNWEYEVAFELLIIDDLNMDHRTFPVLNFIHHLYFLVSRWLFSPAMIILDYHHQMIYYLAFLKRGMWQLVTWMSQEVRING